MQDFKAKLYVMLYTLHWSQLLTRWSPGRRFSAGEGTLVTRYVWMLWR